MSTTIQQLEQLVNEGRFLEARSRSEMLLKDRDDIRVKQLLALSMAKSGAPKAALNVLDPVYQQQPDDPETSGILGGIYKELFKVTRNSKYAVLSRDTYLNNYKLTGDYYTGINAASMSAISGSVSKAKELARELIGRLSSSSSNVWELASLGEAYMLIRENEKSIESYVRCRRAIGADWGKVNSVYNQLWLLNHYVPVSQGVMDLFSPPTVAAFVGHMIDHPNRTLGRFSPGIEDDVKQAIAGAIRSINAKIGYCSMACGGDILFAESMLECGGEVNLFLPFNEEDFIATSVAFAGSDWVRRFESLKKKCQVSYVTQERYLGSDDLFSFQSRVIFGSTVQRAAMLHSSPCLITVYSDVDLVKQVGGTYDTLKFWPADEKRININPQHYVSAAVAETGSANSHAVAPESFPPEARMRHVRYLIYTDVSNASTEDRKQIRYHLDKKIQKKEGCEVTNADDSTIIATGSIDDAAALAWDILGIPDFGRDLKVNLHAGLVTSDGASGMSGTAVETARLINKFSQPGGVYASFQFASILSLRKNEYAVEEAGTVRMTEGTLSVFQVNRHAEVFE